MTSVKSWIIELRVIMRGLNCGYIVSKPGVLKLLSLSLGLISTGFVHGGYQTAKWFQKIAPLIKSPSTDCEDQWEQVDSPTRDLLKMTPCPLELLIAVPSQCIAFCFLASSTLYLISLLCGLQPSKNRQFRRLDMAYHLCAGGCLLISVLSIFTYVGRSFTYVEYICGHSSKLALGYFKIESCRQASLTDIFCVWTFIVAGVLTFLNGLVYLTVGLIINRSN